MAVKDGPGLRPVAQTPLLLVRPPLTRSPLLAAGVGGYIDYLPH